MTRAEFIENVTTWDELLDFCNRNDISVCEDVMSDSEKDEWIEDNLYDYVSHNSWQIVRDMLNEISDGYDYYLHNGGLEFTVLDDYADFDAYKEDVLNDGDIYEIWDEDQDDEELYDYTDEEEQELEEDDGIDPAASEPFTIGELYTVCSGVLHSINQKSEESEKEVNFAFDEFVMNYVKGELKG